MRSNLLLTVAGLVVVAKCGVLK
jgi:hypothetical protein